jgi:hypothetical protein
MCFGERTDRLTDAPSQPQLTKLYALLPRIELRQRAAGAFDGVGGGAGEGGDDPFGRFAFAPGCRCSCPPIVRRIRADDAEVGVDSISCGRDACGEHRGVAGSSRTILTPA